MLRLLLASNQVAPLPISGSVKRDIPVAAFGVYVVFPYENFWFFHSGCDGVMTFCLPYVLIVSDERGMMIPFVVPPYLSTAGNDLPSAVRICIAR